MASTLKSLTLPYSVLDVFSSTPLKGNPLAVVLLFPFSPDNEENKEEGQGYELDQETKLQIAKEFNFSETVFVHAFDHSTRTRRVDIFTTQGEIPFAGHPTIGAVSFVLDYLRPESVYTGSDITGDTVSDGKGVKDTCQIQLKAGLVTGKLNRETGFASAQIPHDVHIHKIQLSWDQVLASQPGLSHRCPSIGGDHAGEKGQNDFNPQIKASIHTLTSIVKGMTFALIDLTAQPELLTRIEVREKVVAEMEDLDQEDGWGKSFVGSLFYVIRPRTSSAAAIGNDDEDELIKIDQRVICIGLEDPATGSASAALCTTLALRMGQDSKRRKYKFELEQGTQMGRKSIIGCQVTLTDDGMRVAEVILSGQTRRTMSGELYI